MAPAPRSRWSTFRRGTRSPFTKAGGLLQYRVLGPVEIIGTRGSVQLGALRQRSVMAMLLIEANHFEPVDRLVDAVWDESPPSTARSQVQICVSALRRSLTTAGVGGTIVTRPPGYLFRVGPDELDLHLFDRLVTEGRGALLEETIDIELQLGRHHEAIGELRVLATEHPARERLRAQLMTALYRAVRQSEALDFYHRVL